MSLSDLYTLNMKDFHQKKSLTEFSDRELLLFILGNQVNLFRQTQYLQQQIKGGDTEPLGHFSETFKELVGDIDDILNQANKHLAKDDTDKGFLKF